MKKEKVLLLIGIITSLIGVIVGALVFIISLNYINDFSNLAKWIAPFAVGFLYIVLTLSLYALKEPNKEVYIAGIILSAIAIIPSFGISIIALIAFILNYSNYKRITSEGNEISNITNDKNDGIDYKLYVNKHIKSYIVSIILSSIYVVAYVAIIIFVPNIIVNETDNILYVLLLFFVVYAFGGLGALTSGIGLLTSILLITNPSRQLLSFSRIFGFINLTFVGAIASHLILNETYSYKLV